MGRQQRADLRIRLSRRQPRTREHLAGRTRAGARPQHRRGSMTRTAIGAAAALAIALATAGTLRAQQPDFSKVEIKTTKVAGNFYTLEGQGGMIGVLAGP